ncbi:cryptochrome/photolyase family protein [Roseibium sp. RKSG952]|uniref:cryptochrome/photolyase family protein n=1 Tax=Roseibium sp. RKSG952 TaxID=2529384 RepID=UPI0012BC413D|nr:cryptochrome/photolyase family protein [Roseibium sp. RKSG952]MTH94937.1 cryptochrome/photolyase family protein [Roseibium sp. RKSG952]
MGNLIVILGDQLSPKLPSLRLGDPDCDRVLMMEVAGEAEYVPHHKKKIAFVFSAMRHFARELAEAGWQVTYVKFPDPDNSGSLSGEVERHVKQFAPDRVVVTEPGEWRVLEAIKGWPEAFDTPVDILTDDRFVCSLSAFRSWADGRKQLRMEYFYREMRKTTGLLMDTAQGGAQPAGGKWNFDADNRKPAKAGLAIPEPKRFEPDTITLDVLELVSDRFGAHFGDLEPFWFATSRQQAEAAFDHFLETALPSFGDYQDAMLAGEKFLYHSVTSVYLNAGLLDPMEMCRRVEAAYHEGHAPLNAAEGFIRQIIGWREYVRGLYWLKMPAYVESNYLGASRDLPSFYWTGETDMACMREAIRQTREEAYAHHIQRLMVTGNFALLIGVEPKQIHEWYLAVYADAYEWVELPNTIGMSQFADGGLLGSKPYASGGNYIKKMSNYCTDCSYDISKKTGSSACPFNYLYWDFIDRNTDRLRGNHRMAQVYSTWGRMGEEKRGAHRESAKVFLSALEDRTKVT